MTTGHRNLVDNTRTECNLPPWGEEARGPEEVRGPEEAWGPRGPTLPSRTSGISNLPGGLNPYIHIYIYTSATKVKTPLTPQTQRTQRQKKQEVTNWSWRGDRETIWETPALEADALQRNLCVGEPDVRLCGRQTNGGGGKKKRWRAHASCTYVFAEPRV